MREGCGVSSHILILFCPNIPICFPFPSTRHFPRMALHYLNLLLCLQCYHSATLYSCLTHTFKSLPCSQSSGLPPLHFFCIFSAFFFLLVVSIGFIFPLLLSPHFTSSVQFLLNYPYSLPKACHEEHKRYHAGISCLFFHLLVIRGLDQSDLQL